MRQKRGVRLPAAAGLRNWEAVATLDEAELERRLYPRQAAPASRPKQRPLPHWPTLREEFARRDHHVTLALLWPEYKAEYPDGYQYSQSVDLYRRFERKLSVRSGRLRTRSRSASCWTSSMIG